MNITIREEAPINVRYKTTDSYDGWTITLIPVALALISLPDI